MLKLGNEDRYETKCASCMRASPVQTGTLAEAESNLTTLAWVKDIDGHWHCPICTTRSTTRLKRFIL